MHYFLVNNEIPLKTEIRIRSIKQAQEIVGKDNVKNIKFISPFQYIYYKLKRTIKKKVENEKEE